MRKYVSVMSTLYVAALLVCCILPAGAAVVTDGLVGYYTVDSLTGSTVSTWANSANGPGAWGSTSLVGATSTGILAAQTPVAGKSAVDMTAGNSIFGISLTPWLNHDVYSAYSGMTILTVLKITDVGFFGGIAGPIENTSIRMGPNSDNAQAVISDSFAAGYSNPVVGKWTILASDMTNNTSGSDTVTHLYQTDYTTGTPTTSSWTAAADASAGAFHIYDGSYFDQFAFGGNTIWYANSPHLCAKSEWAACLVYNKVLTTQERAATIDALYTNFFTTGTDVPEPGSMLALACGLASFAGIAIRRRR